MLIPFIQKTNFKYSLQELDDALAKLIASDSFIQEPNRGHAYPSIVNITESVPGRIIGRSTSVKKEFKGTIFEEIFINHSPISNLQIRLLMPEGSYIAHKDPDLRSHIAIRTNPQAIITNFDTYECMHIPADGSVYTLDARCVHSAMNCGVTPRYHLLWGHFGGKDTDTPYTFTIKVTSDDIFEWQQKYLLDLVIQYEEDLQECILNTAEDFSSRIYHITFSSRAAAVLYIDQLKKVPRVTAFGEYIINAP